MRQQVRFWHIASVSAVQRHVWNWGKTGRNRTTVKMALMTLRRPRRQIADSASVRFVEIRRGRMRGGGLPQFEMEKPRGGVRQALPRRAAAEIARLPIRFVLLGGGERIHRHLGAGVRDPEPAV